MSDQEQKQESTSITPQPEADKEKKSELSEEELKKVTGGTETITFNYGGPVVTYTAQK